MALIINGQVGWWSGTINATPSTPAIWTNIYAVYNADSTGSSSLKTSLFAAYNGESNANDSFGSNNGTAMGGLTYTPGKIGNAFQFNGTTSYVSLPNNSFNFTGDFSISGWINQATAPAYHMIMGNQNSTGGASGYSGWLVWVVNNKLTFDIYDNTSGAASGRWQTTNTLSTNTWIHFTITKKPNQAAKIYLNGTLDSTLVFGSNTANVSYLPTTYSVIGVNKYSSIDGYWNGSIDALNVWNKELTQSEITELYNSGNGAQYITDNFYKPTTNDALNTYNGTAQGGLTYGVGKVGTAFQFNGTNAYVQLGDVMDVGTSSWSYSMWFNTNDGITVQTLFSKSLAGASTGRIWSVFLNNRVTIGFQADGINVINAEMNTSTLGINTWYHLVVVLDRSDKLKIYLNGTLQGLTVTNGTNNLTPYTATNYNTTHPFRIGSYTASDNTTPAALFNGSIDAFNVWNRVLTASEITELYNSGNGKQYPN